MLVERGGGHRAHGFTPPTESISARNGLHLGAARLLENTSNESFLKASLAENAPVDELLRDPEEVGAMRLLKQRPKGAASTAVPGLPSGNSPFRNEPP